MIFTVWLFLLACFLPQSSSFSSSAFWFSLAYHARMRRRTRMISIRYGAPDSGAPSGHIALNCLTQGKNGDLVPFQGKDLHGFPYVDAHGRRMSGKRLWTCCAGRAGTGIRSEALHRM